MHRVQARLQDKRNRLPLVRCGTPSVHAVRTADNRTARRMITAENLSWASTGSLRSADHVAVIETWQNVALCGANIAGMREIRPTTLNLCRGCARELRTLGIDPSDIGIENDLV